MFVGDFNSKLQSFGYAKKNASGPMLKNIQKQLYLPLGEREWSHVNKLTNQKQFWFLLSGGKKC